MKSEQQALFTPDVRAEALRRFNLDEGSVKPLDGFESIILEVYKNGHPFILRVSHASHRRVDQVRAELDWLDYLAQRHVSVCVPQRSRNDSLVEVVEVDGSGFVAVLFEKAPGKHLTRDDMTPQMTYNRGKLIGRMHKLAKAYSPRSETIRRYHWYEEDDFISYPEYLSTSDVMVADRFESLIKTVRSFPTDVDGYGLIHSDAHTGNIFFDGDRPILFDFDDCAYDYYVSDIAITLFYAVLMLPDDVARREHAAGFLRVFLDGYRSENTLNNCWLELIPLILKRREIILYVAITRGMDPDNMEGPFQRYLDERRGRIENNVPYLLMDFTRYRLSD